MRQLRLVARRFSTLKPMAARAKVLRGEGTIEIVAKVLEMQRQGRDIVRLEVGDPDFSSPRSAVDAAIDALERGQTHYEAAGGSPALREAAAGFLRRTRPGLNADASNIVCTPGGKPIIFSTIAALCEEGDEVIYPDPGFPAYETTIEWAGATPVPLRLDHRTGFRFDHDELRLAMSERTKLIILCSPGNPTGGVLGAEDLDVVAECARQTGAWVLSDEIYSQIVYDGDHESLATRDGMLGRTVVLDGCSKAHAMTGWRVGFGLFPPALVDPVRNLAINSFTCLPPFVSAGAIAALDGAAAETEAMRSEFRSRRDVVYERLSSVPGLSVAVRPQGAMYMLVDVTATGLSSSDFERRLLDEFGVSLLDGAHFGPGGEGFVRISFAQSQERLEEGCRRIAEFAQKLAHDRGDLPKGPGGRASIAASEARPKLRSPRAGTVYAV